VWEAIGFTPNFAPILFSGNPFTRTENHKEHEEDIFDGIEATGAAPVENHASFDAFGDTGEITTGGDTTGGDLGLTRACTVGNTGGGSGGENTGEGGRVGSGGDAGGGGHTRGGPAGRMECEVRNNANNNHPALWSGLPPTWVGP